ncbi:type II toxin-antitoxin system PemK/MazF family toxin [Enterococcus dongliensis]|uniref:Type II toxin-antitoxin system PemK/MazF family toxin n=1 Tax=Enterococcus dongliensis TaxID=2559925 RepID=A0AAW8TII7_9ENTE|nr:type II toxin-antitoxin system PemK/MazF family toxin [Enterococcus dongliensis]MDT2597284.1 type II toxin-antitoxin system PemK/MazF family toxin [Enterococcus dongliensis]MDT2604438.1 type II toxin-antitoxin system PemK/MazF family toxin [Enterococcus dongliensis]MDT2614604.1 type II toxin-antitoxin system PemK/MazF family toxin [Enterococcus dongliensis]MDT2635153.1 type II toxin-antitoxin system PemK/MazF family toxin [Enterococcus dongliensis]MDT2637843.1 type II toxin-antitoxin system
MIEQGQIVTLSFDPSNGAEIQKYRPALVMSRDEYNKSGRLIIVCPITSTEKKAPYLIPINSDVFKKESKVNIRQVYSLDYTKEGNRNVKVLGNLDRKDFLQVAQIFLQNFNFPF